MLSVGSGFLSVKSEVCCCCAGGAVTSPEVSYLRGDLTQTGLRSRLSPSLKSDFLPSGWSNFHVLSSTNREARLQFSSYQVIGHSSRTGARQQNGNNEETIRVTLVGWLKSTLGMF